MDHCLVGWDLWVGIGFNIRWILWLCNGFSIFVLVDYWYIVWSKQPCYLVSAEGLFLSISLSACINYNGMGNKESQRSIWIIWWIRFVVVCYVTFIPPLKLNMWKEGKECLDFFLSFGLMDTFTVNKGAFKPSTSINYFFLSLI